MRHNIDELSLSGYAHIPVLWREILEFIEDSVAAGSGYLADCTLGEGGHSELFLKTFTELKIIAFERDGAILDVARKRLEPFGDRIRFVNDNFDQAGSYLDEYGIKPDYFLYDFGISSYHYDKSGRGFTFRDDEPLDMRLSGSFQELNAAYVVKTYKEKELADIFYTYGEERWSRKIAAVIVKKRAEKKIETSAELANIVLGAIPKKFHVKNIHPATRVFQALRIEVNDELSAIEKSLNDAYGYLGENGRIMAISFHSLEDRIVKNRFRRMARGCTCDLEPKHCMCNGDSMVKILTKKPVVPQEDEVRMNNRARSSKLRVCEKIG